MLIKYGPDKKNNHLGLRAPPPWKNVVGNGVLTPAIPAARLSAVLPELSCWDQPGRVATAWAGELTGVFSSL